MWRNNGQVSGSLTTANHVPHAGLILRLIVAVLYSTLVDCKSRNVFTKLVCSTMLGREKFACLTPSSAFALNYAAPMPYDMSDGIILRLLFARRTTAATRCTVCAVAHRSAGCVWLNSTTTTPTHISTQTRETTLPATTNFSTAKIRTRMPELGLMSSYDIINDLGCLCTGRHYVLLRLRPISA